MQQKERRSSYSATAWMELESIMVSEISQAVKDKYHVISHISEYVLPFTGLSFYFVDRSFAVQNLFSLT